MEKEYWQQFISSGNVEDYLSYRMAQSGQMAGCGQENGGLEETSATYGLNEKKQQNNSVRYI